jgi:hypothetical protein
MNTIELKEIIENLEIFLEELISKFQLYKELEKNKLDMIYEILANKEHLKKFESKLLGHEINLFIKEVSKFKKLDDIKSNKFDEKLKRLYSFLNDTNLFDERLGTSEIISFTKWETFTAEDGTQQIKNEANDPEFLKKNKEEYLNTYSNKIEEKIKVKKAISKLEYNDIFDNYEPALKVKEIAKVFSSYLLNYSSEHTTTLIGIFGKWGRGKTLFCNQIQLTMEENENIHFLKFQPWKYQEKESLWAYFYQNLLNKYLANKNKYRFLPNFIINFFKILKLNYNRLGLVKLIFPLLILLISGIFIFTGLIQKIEIIYSLYLLFGTGFLILFYKLYKFFISNKDTVLYLYNHYGRKRDFSEYLGFQNEIEKEIKILINTYISDKNEKLILFIDDLDRCDEKLIIHIMDTLRLVLEDRDINSKIMIVCAIDEEILMNSIRFKYFDNKFNVVNPKDYIEKFFLLGLKLSKLDSEDIFKLTDTYIEKLNSLINLEKDKNDYKLEINEKIKSNKNKMQEQNIKDDNKLKIWECS